MYFRSITSKVWQDFVWTDKNSIVKYNWTKKLLKKQT